MRDGILRIMFVALIMPEFMREGIGAESGIHGIVVFHAVGIRRKGGANPPAAHDVADAAQIAVGIYQGYLIGAQLLTQERYIVHHAVAGFEIALA